jgi:hypothetical protein
MFKDHYKSYNKIDRFRIAIDVTKGLVDLHDLGDKGQSAVIHSEFDNTLHSLLSSQ